MTSSILKPAVKYLNADDLCLITTYFNPTAYKSKLKNFKRFISPIQKAGLNHIIVECAFDKNKFEIEKSRSVIHVRSKDVLWQKERLLNIALQNVPANCRKILWIDSDVLFTNAAWAQETSMLLEEYPIVQPFEYAIRLPKNRTSFSYGGLTYNGFAKIYKKYPNALTGGDFNIHGHTGFAWAARKEVFYKSGFYDVCLSGVADHLMAHSFCGDWHSPCIRRMFLNNTNFYSHYEFWSRTIYPKVNGRLTYCKGAILHLWHGNHQNRRYLENMQLLSSKNFNPTTDIQLNKSGCWEVNEKNEDLVWWTRDYFKQRQED